MSIDTNKIFLRPRFSIDVQKSRAELIELFRKVKTNPQRKFLVRVVDEHIYIDIPQKDNHFWSPHLHLELVSEEDGNTKVKGLFGPKPQVWTFFMFVHFVVATLFFGFGIWAYVGSTLEETPIFPIVMLVILPILWIFLYLFGRLGRDFGKKQILEMQVFLIELLEIKS